jgi:hypothetical protein
MTTFAMRLKKRLTTFAVRLKKHTANISPLPCTLQKKRTTNIRPLPCAMLKTHDKDNVPAAGMVTLLCADQKTHGKETYIFLFLFFTFNILIQTKITSIIYIS